MPFENMFTHQTNILIFAHDPEAEPRGILLIKEMTLLKSICLILVINNVTESCYLPII